MNKSEFLVALEDILQREDACHEGDDLNTYAEWDSLSKMSLMAYYDRYFGIKISLDDLKNVNYVSDLLGLAGDKIND